MITAAYDDIAAEYAASADRHVYRHLARPLADALTGFDAPLLDVAAGTGALGRSFRDVVAVDVSANQLAHNPARFRVVADAERLPFRDDSFHVAGCAFGINHFPNPGTAIREMARVSPVVGVLTWLRPEHAYAPRQAVDAVLSRHFGRTRSAMGVVLDAQANAVGSVPAVVGLLAAADLRHRVTETEVTVPWPGVDAYLDYRLSVPSAVRSHNDPVIRREAASAISGLSREDLEWTVPIVLGVGWRRSTRAVADGESAAAKERLATFAG